MFSRVVLLSTALLGLTTACRYDDSDVNPSTGVPNCYKWSVTQWSAGLVRRGAHYDFHVSGPDDGRRPHFLAYCTGEQAFAAPGVTAEYKVCDVQEGLTKGGNTSPTDQGNGLQVWAKLEPYDSAKADGIAKIWVKMQYSDESSAQWTQEGWYGATFNQFVGGGETFDINPGAVVGS
ncbi:hypothetical protein EJ03DRAFT_331289 [Teratosphaeria nubilosa]|uniref:Uncharacterized protein n=1 Tax=Teratosphaeria nubilosa TaxID=161662 RepID=A0A6G1KWU5_9PEZI|nr:hypothetical protein EJ03DRAFT_331289 [Teratosphaeria nubilosa]